MVAPTVKGFTATCQIIGKTFHSEEGKLYPNKKQAEQAAAAAVSFRKRLLIASNNFFLSFHSFPSFLTPLLSYLSKAKAMIVFVVLRPSLPLLLFHHYVDCIPPLFFPSSQVHSSDISLASSSLVRFPCSTQSFNSYFT